jgi:cytochrome P450
MEPVHAPGNQQADLISLLLASNNVISVGRNHNLPNSYLRDNIMTIFLAGHETVANALTWTFYLLSQNNREEYKLHEEVDSVLGQGVSLTAADIPRLGYAKKVLAESLRLYPPAWALGCQAIQECKIGGYTIPTGSTVLISQYITHRDSRFFPEPKRFNPDRWTNKTNADLPRFSYFPFGGGPRSCIGEPFAWMEAILLLSTICYQWKMYHDPNHKVELKPLVTLRPKYGMSMKLERRR